MPAPAARRARRAAGPAEPSARPLLALEPARAAEPPARPPLGGLEPARAARAALEAQRARQTAQECARRLLAAPRGPETRIALPDAAAAPESEAVLARPAATLRPAVERRRVAVEPRRPAEEQERWALPLAQAQARPLLSAAGPTEASAPATGAARHSTAQEAEADGLPPSAPAPPLPGPEQDLAPALAPAPTAAVPQPAPAERRHPAQRPARLLRRRFAPPPNSEPHEARAPASASYSSAHRLRPVSPRRPLELSEWSDQRAEQPDCCAAASRADHRRRAQGGQRHGALSSRASGKHHERPRRTADGRSAPGPPPSPHAARVSTAARR